MITHGLGIFMKSLLFRRDLPEKNSRYLKTFGRQQQRKRKVKDSSSIKCGKLSGNGQRGILYMTRLIWYRLHHLILWPVLNAGPYTLRKSFHAFYSAAPAAGIFSPALNMPKYQERREGGNCLSRSLFLQSGSVFQ